ncbi:MAG: hypothetical protein HYS07_05760 [Chlamydiae bacterium]|nr:hypothetical protein [Chlamydiota bacterium]MBI3277934.1 hypothetical protein [Chlamydiota bacterium]
MNSHQKLLSRRRKALSGIRRSILKIVVRGSIRTHGNICGTPGYRCKRKENPLLHGPYHYLSFRGSRGNHSIMIMGERKRKVEQGIRNYKWIMKELKRISDIDFRMLRNDPRGE